ncbi:L,D-transpeptidase family protein [Undibacterium fentianense]|uniref:L,D-transpeptidase family protein n=1 Tax=Undibacterium fentianense TaxID=2828728 RepID=A0A941DWU4_9BURK|nr:L,D-transpeptidase family protein [Undibacterium fentianense]MBR7798819.1 L,D-transpeptidase family protein [Undibacterium fentianense]
MRSFYRSKAPIYWLIGAISFPVLSTVTILLAKPNVAFANNNPSNKVVLQTGERSGPNADLLLIEIYRFLANNELDKAQAKVDELLIAYPNFHLGHLIRGDLIAMRARPIARFGNVKNAPQDKLRDLNDEAVARLRAITERPSKDQIPSVLLQLNDEQRYALVMDAKRARLYLYENVAGVPSLVSDYYVSQGKLGMDKFKEGDQRTPVGVYYITNRLPGSKLPDFYGPGALPLNYPNEWDKLKGRGGSGIWLHGVPSTNYSRAPLASDGCVVLANPDFLKIAATVDVAKTPVIITEKIEFLSKAAWLLEKQQARILIENWQQSFNTQNPNSILPIYSKNFKGINSEGASSWVSRQIQSLGSSINAFKVREISQFKYPGREELIVANFTIDVQTNKGLTSSKRRQYWAKESGLWRIVYEDNNQVAGIKIEPEAVREIAKVNTRGTQSTDDKFKTPSKIVATNSNTINTVKATNTKSNAKAQAEVMQSVNRWLNVWSSKNTTAYLAHYAKDFQTPNGESRKSWMEERRARIEGKGKISVKIDTPTIQIEGNLATVKFRQNYQSGALVASSRKTLVMVKQDGKWLIKQEKTGS